MSKKFIKAKQQHRAAASSFGFGKNDGDNDGAGDVASSMLSLQQQQQQEQAQSARHQGGDDDDMMVIDAIGPPQPPSAVRQGRQRSSGGIDGLPGNGGVAGTTQHTFGASTTTANNNFAGLARMTAAPPTDSGGNNAAAGSIGGRSSGGGLFTSCFGQQQSQQQQATLNAPSILSVPTSGSGGDCCLTMPLTCGGVGGIGGGSSGGGFGGASAGGTAAAAAAGAAAAGGGGGNQFQNLIASLLQNLNKNNTSNTNNNASAGGTVAAAPANRRTEAVTTEQMDGIAQQLNQLSIQERQQIDRDIYGVSSIGKYDRIDGGDRKPSSTNVGGIDQDGDDQMGIMNERRTIDLRMEQHDGNNASDEQIEDPIVISQKLDTMEQQILQAYFNENLNGTSPTSPSALTVCIQNDLTFLQDKEFCLAFLRSEGDYDPYKAATRLIEFLELKRLYWGESLLTKKHITQSDMNQDDIDCLNSGFVQHIPKYHFDSSNRPIIISIPALDPRNFKNYSQETYVS